MGKRIRGLRKARGWNQQTLAHEADTRLMTVSEWERDLVTRHDPKVLSGIARALGVDEAWLVYGDDVGNDTALVPAGWREWVASNEGMALSDAERDALHGMGQAATAAGYRVTPAAYSAWRVALQMFGNPPTTR